jgi:hypothetical protein
LGPYLPEEIYELFKPLTIPWWIAGVANVLYAGIIFLFVIPSITWFVPASLYTLVRALFILMTKDREREILSKDIETAEVVAYEHVNSDL